MLALLLLMHVGHAAAQYSPKATQWTMKPGDWEGLKINYASPVPVDLAKARYGPWDKAPNLGNGRLGTRMHDQVLSLRPRAAAISVR
jgi:hypothetical protein